MQLPLPLFLSLMIYLYINELYYIKGIFEQSWGYVLFYCENTHNYVYEELRSIGFDFTTSVVINFQIMFNRSCSIYVNPQLPYIYIYIYIYIYR